MIKNVNILLSGLIECICLNKIHYVMEALMQKKIYQWKQILNEYEESLKEITSPKRRREDRFKKIQER